MTVAVGRFHITVAISSDRLPRGAEPVPSPCRARTHAQHLFSRSKPTAAGGSSGAVDRSSGAGGDGGRSAALVSSRLPGSFARWSSVTLRCCGSRAAFPWSEIKFYFWRSHGSRCSSRVPPWLSAASSWPPPFPVAF